MWRGSQYALTQSGEGQSSLRVDGFVLNTLSYKVGEHGTFQREFTPPRACPVGNVGTRFTDEEAETQI